MEVLPLFEGAITAEFASLTTKGAPLTYPVTPYIVECGTTLVVSTGLTHPTKAERARRNPKVALLFSDPVGSGLSEPPVVLVQGLGAVRDADLQANTDSYIQQSYKKLPEAYTVTPASKLRRMAWEAAQDLAVPESDPAPQGIPPVHGAPRRRTGAPWRDMPSNKWESRSLPLSMGLVFRSQYVCWELRCPLMDFSTKYLPDCRPISPARRA